MCNKTYSQLTDAQKTRKFDIAIRNRTGNLLSAEKVGLMNRNISLKRQYSITVHKVKDSVISVKVAKNILHIFIPESLYWKELKT